MMPRKHDRDTLEQQTAQPKVKRQRLTDTQLERKRELDREAQRTIRERTKSHIAHLEALVEQLQGEQGGQVERLVAQLNESRQEINRLRDALSSIVKISSTVAGIQPPALLSTKLDHVKIEPSPPESNPELLYQQPDRNDDTEHIGVLKSQLQPCTDKLQQDQLEEYLTQPESVKSVETNTVDLKFYDSFELELQRKRTDEEEVEEIITVDDTDNKQLCIPSLATRIDNDARLDGRYWYLAGVLLSHILKIHQRTPYPISHVHDEDIACRAVLEGWDAVRARYSLDAGWQWLKELDTRIYLRHFGPAERLMNLRNSRCILLHQMYPDAGWDHKLPAFYSARPSQEYLQHDPLIEYFPWPSFRERLLFFPRKFATNKFMDALRRNFNLVWALESDNLCQRDSISDRYFYSDIFTKHIADMKCYTVKCDFFDQFPELKQDIPWINTSPMSMISHRLSIASSHADSTRRTSLSSVEGDDDQSDGFDSIKSGSHIFGTGRSIPTSPSGFQRLRMSR